MKFHTVILSSLVSLGLVACGGGGGGSSSSGNSTPVVPSPATNLTVSGTAATGLAIAGASVAAKCLVGAGTATTLADGSYSLVIAGGALPCVLQITNPDGSKLHSVATGTGNEAVANITPLTEMVVARIFTNDPTIAFAGFDTTTANTVITTATVKAAQTDVGNVFTGTVDTGSLANFITTPLKPATASSLMSGDAQDKLLDALKAKISNAQLLQVVSSMAYTKDIATVKDLVIALAQTHVVGVPGTSQPANSITTSVGAEPGTTSVTLLPSTSTVVLPVLPQFTAIPDAGFEQALIDLGLDDVIDGKVTTANISKIQTLVIAKSYNITNLKGIESFVSLEKLELEHNKLQTLDLSSNVNLIWLSVWDNKLTSIDVTKLVNLQVFCISQNDMSSVDITKNIALKEIAFQNDSDGVTPYGTTKGLTSLDITQNVNMERIYIGYNLITAVDVSHNKKLTEFHGSTNKIQSLDFSNNPVMNLIYADHNQLGYLNIKGTANNGVPRACDTDNNPGLYNILVTNVQAILDYNTYTNGTTGIVSAIYMHDAWTTYAL